MARVQSFFGDLASDQNIQVLIDNSLDALQGASIWRQWLDVGIPRPTLTFETAIGRSRIEAAASIVDPDAPAPLRSRNQLELLTGNIPTIKEKFAMKQSDMRALEAIRAARISDNARKDALIRKLWDDTSKAAVAGDKRVDIMLLQAISTLTVDCSVTNNPDGVAFGTVDLLAKSYQKQGVPVVWTDFANSTPVDDIENFVQYMWNTYGRMPGKIVMSYNMWIKFKRSAQVIARIQSFFNIGKANASFAITENTVNEYFASNMWPAIEIIQHVSGIEKDGVVTPYRAFNDNNIVFMPTGKIGTLENAYPMELMHPVEFVNYATFGSTLVSKWRSNDPIVEYTGMELNAFPAIDVDGIFILTTDIVQASFV